MNKGEDKLKKLSQAWISQLPINSVENISQVGGGDVNLAFKVETNDTPLFLLVQPNRGGEFFNEEIAGLKELEKAGITAPQVIGSGTIKGDGYLLITYLEEGTGRQKDLGHLVAKLHRYQSDKGKFGFTHDYQGSDVRFSNQWTDSWIELFVERRLDHLKERLVQQNKWTSQQTEKYKKVRRIIISSLEKKTISPSLLHGDLWAGNYMFLANGKPALFDPHAVYGDRELDLGVTTVFGGFDQDFYQAYQEKYPLDPGFEQRLEYYRLYMLMIHQVKFGGTYAQSVDHSLGNILKTT